MIDKHFIFIYLDFNWKIMEKINDSLVLWMAKSYYKCFFVHFILLHILLFIFNLYLYIFSCVVTYFALSIERTWPDLHFTTDYFLYNWVCDE